jgi:hypothetical protein
MRHCGDALAVLGNGRVERESRERMCTRQLRQIIVSDRRCVGGGGEEMRCELNGLERYWIVDSTIQELIYSSRCGWSKGKFVT